MRRAIQKCSTSLPRTLASLPYRSTRYLTSNGLRQPVLRLSPSSIRQIHQTSLFRQQAAAPAQESQDGNSIISRFEELETRNVVHPNIVKTLTGPMGLETMTEVQKKTINEALGGQDMIAQAKTGTGKTLAFLLPVLQNILSVDPELARPSNSRRGPRTTADDIRALIVSPTRELAEQIAVEAKKVTRNTGLLVQTAVGGTQKRAGLAAIQRQGCHILVGTPGRLKDILSDPYSKVEAPDLSALVFDEADRLLDQGFWPEIQDIMRMLPTPQEKDRQTLMFSATVPHEVISLVRNTLKRGFQFVKCVGDNEDLTHSNVPQRIVKAQGFENTLPTLVELCAKKIEESKQPGAKPFKAIVYFNSTAEVTLAASALGKLDRLGDQPGRHPWAPTKLFEIHSRLTQVARTDTAERFRRAESAILFSSDVTARGMDFPNVTHVIQMGLPTSEEQYVHRVGRTARAGKEGESWLIVNPIEAQEAKFRLRKSTIKQDDSLEIAKLDMSKEAQVNAATGAVLSMYQDALRKIPDMLKSNVYRAQLGVHSWVRRKEELIHHMNRLARFGWGMTEPPHIAPQLAMRLGLGRVPGVRGAYGAEQDRAPAMRSDDRGDRFGGQNRSSGGFGGRRDYGFGRGMGGLDGERGQRGYGGRGRGMGGFDGGRGDRGYGGRGRGMGGFDGGRESRYGGRTPGMGRSDGGRGSFGDRGRKSDRYSDTRGGIRAPRDIFDT